MPIHAVVQSIGKRIMLFFELTRNEFEQMQACRLAAASVTPALAFTPRLKRQTS